MKLFLFCILETEQRFILRKEMEACKREVRSLVDSTRGFLKFLLKGASAYKLHYQKQALKLDLQS